MKNKLLLIVLSIFVLLSGCSKDNASGGMKISRIYAGVSTQTEFSYTTAGLLLNETRYSMPGKKTFEITCHYDANNRLIKKESAFDVSSSPNPQWSYSYTDYTYTPDGKISEEKNYLKQNNVYILRSIIRPAFDASGKLISRTQFSPGDTLTRLTTYQYNSKGNIILQEEFKYNGTVPELEHRYSYDDYDNKRNPYIDLNGGVPPFSINRNNILQTTVTNYVLTPGFPVTTINKAVYRTYNKNGLPVNVYENGTDFVYEYK